MKIISFANNQDLLYSSAWEHGDHMHYEGVDPHFWVSPKSAYRIVSDIRDLLVALKPESASKYQENYTKLVSEISTLDREIMEMLSPWSGGSFMIYHPVLGYFARDYGFKQIAVEHEGKEPSPADMASLIDKVRELGIKTIFIQQEFDSRNAGVIASQTGATVVTIDPLSADWNTSVRNIAKALAGSFAGNQ
jgi:zinc transport system substrate-binding protein